MERPKTIHGREVFEFADLGSGYALAVYDASVRHSLPKFNVILCLPPRGGLIGACLLHDVPGSDLGRAKALLEAELDNRKNGRAPRYAQHATVPST